jgi:hypothetical protein
MAATIASSHEGLEIYCIRYGRVPLTFGFDFRAAFFTGLGLLAIASSSDGCAAPSPRDGCPTAGLIIRRALL